MIISEVNAILDLVRKATNFCTLVQDGWYKGSAELDAFQDNVLMLSAKHSQWSEQLQRYGISEDKHLLRLVTLAEEALEKQQESVQKLQRSPFRRLKKRVFPGQLSYLLDKVLQIVDAGPQLLVTKVTNIDLLEKYTAQTPASLSFGQDTKYVPIVDTIFEVRSALESAEEPRVVTLYGGPGMGKSSLVKYVDIHYQEEKKRLHMHTSLPKPVVFPDGVYYLFCRRQANNRVRLLQLELLQSLGFGTGFVTPTDSNSPSGGQEGDFLAVPSPQMKLKSRLAEQKLLIILDDLWEETVLQEVLVPAKGVKYLVTSQMRDIHSTAKTIQIRRPTHAGASRIMANYTDGLPQRGEFPRSIQIVTDDIIRKLEHHPLSLANIGISINSNRATDTCQWDVIKENLHAYLAENDFRTPSAYDRPYNLPVSASMMLMVDSDSLPIEKRRLLFLMALLAGQSLPEPLVKFFYSFLEPTNFAVKYNTHERFLEDKSLLELRVIQGSGPMLDSHSLRSHYIREKRALELRSLGSEILVSSGAEDVLADQKIAMGDTEGTLATILSAMYYEQSLKDIVASTLENHIKVVNGGVIPRSLNMWAETMDLVESARNHKHEIEYLVWLLNSHDEEWNWKQQAHHYAKKIIIKFVCQGKLDDDSMASLLRLPQTTSTASRALVYMYSCHKRDFYYQDIRFSSAYGEIMQTLLALSYNDQIAIERRQAVMVSLLHVLDYESEDTIFKVAEKYKSLLAMDSNPSFQDAIVSVLSGHTIGQMRQSMGRGVLTLAEFPGLLDDLMALLLFGKDHDVRRSAAVSILHLSGNRRIALRIAIFPNALQMLFDSFISEDMFVLDDYIHQTIGDILSCLSIVPESRFKFREIQGIWEGLGSILADLEGTWGVPRDKHHRRMLERRASTAATIFGYLGLEKDFRDTIASLPGVGEGLQFLQLTEMAGDWNYKRDGIDNQDSWDWRLECYCSTRALTILYPNPAEQRSTIIPAFEDVLEIIATDEGPKSKSIAMASAVPDICYFSIYWTRVLAYIQMGSYEDSLSNLNLAHRHYDLIPKLRFGHTFCQSSSGGYERIRVYSEVPLVFRDCRVFLQAMQEDYAGALSGDNSLGLVETGVLKWLSGDLQAALEDLNAAAVEPFYEYSNIFKHRGYLKFLMGDETGAREDAEYAQKLELKESIVDELCFDQGQNLWQLEKIPVSYLGFSF